MIPLNARRAFVAAFAAAGGVWIAQAMQFPFAHWTVITALALVNPGADGTFRKTVFRVAGTWLAALSVIAIFAIPDPQPGWIIIGSFSLIGVGLLLSPHSPAPYAVLLWFGVGGAFALICLDDPLNAPSLVGYRAFHIAIGSVLVLIGSLLVRFREDPALTPPAPPAMETVEHTLRVLLACFLTLVAAALLDRPSWAGSLVISVVVLSIFRDAQFSSRKGLLRLSGAFSGGAISILYYVFLIDMATGIFSLLCVIFVVVWGCALLLSHRTLAYLGIQTGLVFAWSVGDSFGPNADVWIPLTRTAQVAIATAIYLAVQSARVPDGLASRWLAAIKPSTKPMPSPTREGA